MEWVLLVVGFAVACILLLLFVRTSAQDADEEALQEAKQATPEELEEVLHPKPKTKDEVEAENDMYEDK